jgi:hypothetical protein
LRLEDSLKGKGTKKKTRPKNPLPPPEIVALDDEVRSSMNNANPDDDHEGSSSDEDVHGVAVLDAKERRAVSLAGVTSCVLNLT